MTYPFTGACIESDLKEIGCDSADWISPTTCTSVGFCEYGNETPVPQKAGNFLTCSALLYGIPDEMRGDVNEDGLRGSAVTAC
jgi:hypothetical protein